MLDVDRSSLPSDAGEVPGPAATEPPGVPPSTDAPATRSMWWRLIDSLPMGRRLDDATFVVRHQVAMVTAILLTAFVFVLGVVNGETVGHVSFDVMPAVLAIAVAMVTTSRTWATLSVAFALMTVSSLLVHFTDGLIESHFLFFVLLPLVALYQDWRAFLGAIGYVVLHHAIMGTITPEQVYNHPAAVNDPVTWGIVHALFVVGLVVVLVIEWNFAEKAQRLAEDRLRELQVAQAELVQAQKLESVGQLAAGIAHEINTPMQYIGDNAHFLKATVQRLLAVADAAEAAVADDASDAEREALAAVLAKSKVPLLKERAPKAADDALAGVENVSRIVTAMKRFSHPGSDEFEPVDLNEAISTTITVARNEWKYNAEVVTDFADDLPMIQGRLGPLNQVWLNMIVNATHAIADAHGDAKGTITIGTDLVDEGASVKVTITDDGAGIAPEHLAKVFDHFFTTKEVGKGTGQGLSIAHQVIAAEHHGRLDVESTVGEGTTFTITLPVAQPSSHPDGGTAEAGAGS